MGTRGSKFSSSSLTTREPLPPSGWPSEFGRKLDASLKLLLPYEVPYALPLTRPAVPVEFLEGQLRALASKVPMGFAGHIYLCRDKNRTLHLILKPGSIVILGGRKRWWPTAEHRLARMLKKDGHHVILAESR